MTHEPGAPGRDETEFRQGRKYDVVQTGNRLTIAGLVVLAAAMTCALSARPGAEAGSRPR